MIASNSAQLDAIFELICICQEFGLWLMKHAAHLSAKDEIKMEDAKLVHSSLRRAGGVFKAMQEDYVSRLLSKPEAGSDLDPRVRYVTVIPTIAVNCNRILLVTAPLISTSARPKHRK